MSNKKIRTLIIAAVIVILAAGALTVFGLQKYEEYNEATYLKIDGEKLRRDSVSLDLSGKPVEELEKIKELTALEQLNLRGTGITAEQYDDLQAALPGCEILWSVPFQGAFYDNDCTELTIAGLEESDLDALDHLTGLKKINAEDCSDYELLAQLVQRHPDAEVTYSIELAGTRYSPSQETLEFTDPDVAELTEKLKYLPKVHTVVLDGTLPENEVLFQLFDAYPGTMFDCDINLFGLTLNTMAESIDLSGQNISDAASVESVLPYFPNLTYVEMCGCGVPNKDMDAMNRRHQDIRFVWTVEVSGVTVRTDIDHFMPYLHDLEKLGDCSNLRYCTDVVALDFGHYALLDWSFLEYMPKLEYLLLCQSPITDVSVISNCTSLKYLEIFLTRVTDYWPLTNLTNLEDLNISYNPFFYINKKVVYKDYGDITPLYQMTWLDRLWMANARLDEAEEIALQNALPTTTILFHSKGSTTGGWRHTLNYYKQRDILGLWYMIA